VALLWHYCGIFVACHRIAPPKTERLEKRRPFARIFGQISAVAETGEMAGGPWQSFKFTLQVRGSGFSGVSRGGFLAPKKPVLVL